jgi:GLPGLI family protein
MIKKMLTIILLFLSLCSFGQQDGAHNNLKIAYELAFQQDSTSRGVKKETMFLFLGPQSSIFQSANQFYKDSLTLRRDKFGEKVQLGKYWSEFMFRIIKSGQKEMVVVDAIGDDLFSYREDPSAIRWDIRNDTATMSGFPCQKAVAVYAGREWIAWFTSEVPSSEGPYKFSGLPGLIVHISDTRQHYVF